MAELQRCPECGSFTSPPDYRDSDALTAYKKRWQWWMALLNLGYVLVLIWEWRTHQNVDPLHGGLKLWAVDAVFCAVFAIDYGARMAKCAKADRWRYAFKLVNMLDVLVIISPVLAFRGAQAVGILRLVRVGKGVWSVVTALFADVDEGLKRIFTRQRIKYALNVAIVVAIMAFFVVYEAERRAADSAPAPATEVAANTIDGPTDAVWWLTETVTSTGYGETTIQSTVARWAGIVLMSLGIVILSLVTAWVSSILIGKDDDAEHAAIMKSLDEVKAMIGGPVDGK